MELIARMRRLRSRRTSRRRSPGVATLAAGALLVGGVGAALAATAFAGPPPPPHPATLSVSPTGSPNNRDTSCTDAAYTSIQAAVDAASAGDTVEVCAGTYDEQVVISTSRLSLAGEGASSVVTRPQPRPSKRTSTRGRPSSRSWT